MSEKKYSNLKELLAESKSAYDYFSSLSQDVREKVNEHNDSITSEKQMKSCAEKYL